MDEMHRFLLLRDPLDLDDGTLDRLLDGMPVDDSPPRYRGVARVIGALQAAPTAAELAGEREAVTLMAARWRRGAQPSARRRRSGRKRRRQLAGAALVGAATLVVGLGAAGALPGAAQRVASDVLATVGVSTPSPSSHADDHPDVRGRSGDAADTVDPTSTDVTVPDAASSGQGSTISSIATDDATTGVDQGAAVSSAASDGQSQAGQHGAPADGATPPGPAATAPVPTPNPGGSTTGDTASGGTSEPGTTTGDTASGGRASAGAGNAQDGLTHKP